MKRCLNNKLGVGFATLCGMLIGVNSQATVIFQDDFSSGSIAKNVRLYETQIDKGWVKVYGYGSVVESAWIIADGVAKNSSTVAAGSYSLSTAAESPLTQVFSNNAASSDTHLRFSFDYAVAAGNTLYVHLWGYTGTVVTASGFLSNTEAAANGGANNSEGSSGSKLDAFNLKDGATSGFGGAATAISEALTGSGTFEILVSIGALKIQEVNTVGDLSHFRIGIAKNVNDSNTSGTTAVDNVSLVSETSSVVLQDDFNYGSVATTFRIYESGIDQGWEKCIAGGGGTVSEWNIAGGVVANASTNAATWYPHSKPAEAALVQTVSNFAKRNTHLTLSFDYSVAAGDTLLAHLWGYTGTAAAPAGWLSNIEASANGGLQNDEGADGSTLDAFNMKDGATSGFGGANSAISGPLDGSGTFYKQICISDLNIPQANNTADFNYFMIAFAKNVDASNTSGNTFIDNLSLMTAPVPLIQQGTIMSVHSGRDALRQPDYSYAYWLNGWRKNKSDTTQPIFAIDTSHYALTLNPADFSKAGFAIHNKPSVGYAGSLQAGTASLHHLPSTELVLEIETAGTTYRAINCKAGLGSDSRRLSAARMWESGRFVQHYDFLEVNFKDSTGKALACTGTLELVAWPASLTLTASLAPLGSAWTDTTLRLALTGKDFDHTMEKRFEGKWAAGEEGSVTLNVQSPRFVRSETNISIQVSSVAGQIFPVAFEPKKDCFVASVTKLKRSFAGGYTDIRDYDEFAITVENQGSVGRELPFLLDFRSPANITGLCPMLCDSKGHPTGTPVQLSKNWHYPEMGEYLMAYALLPAKPGRSEYKLRVVYGFYGTLPSASHSQLCLIGYGGNGRWEQLAIGCWGETICFDMDMSLTDIAVTDVRMLMARNGLNGNKWGWTDAGWGGDWLGMKNRRGEKLAFNELKTAYLAHGPSLSDVRHAGFYGADREVALEAQVQTLRTDDYARTFQKLKYTFNINSTTKLSWLYKMGQTSDLVTPQIAYGNGAGLIAAQQVPSTLKPSALFVNKKTLEGDAPFWISFPGAYHINGRDWGTGYRALVIRSYQAIIGGMAYNQPTISMPVNKVQKNGKGVDLDLLLVAPKEFHPGDTVEMDLEWITLPRVADDYYGPNETFRDHLTQNPSSWKSTYREAAGNDLHVTVKGGKVLNRYPIIIRADKPAVEVTIQGGVGYVPIRFEGLPSIKELALFEIIGNNKVKLDQAVHGNDYWQSDYDEGSQTYKLTYNLPLDNKPTSKWILKRADNL